MILEQNKDKRPWLPVSPARTDNVPDKSHHILMNSRINNFGEEKKKKILYKPTLRSPLKEYSSLKSFSRRYKIPYNMAEDLNFERKLGRQGIDLDQCSAPYYSTPGRQSAMVSPKAYQHSQTPAVRQIQNSNSQLNNSYEQIDKIYGQTSLHTDKLNDITTKFEKQNRSIQDYNKKRFSMPRSLLFPPYLSKK